MCWTVPLSIIRSFSLYTQPWCMSYRFADSLWAGSGSMSYSLLAACEQDQDPCHTVCWQLASRIRIHVIQSAGSLRAGSGSWSWSSSSSRAVNKPVWHIPLLCVQWKTPDDGQRNCLKHAEFCFKNKFDKFVHVVGFIIRIYRDARSPERQMSYMV